MRSRPSRQRRLVAMALAVLGIAAPAVAESLDYEISLPRGEEVRYELELQVRHPGILRVDAVWSTNRVLSFRLTPPDGATVRRSGPSPQEFEVEVGPAGSRPGAWNLAIFSLAGLAPGTGRLSVELPGPTPPVRPPAPAARVPDGEPRPSWSLARRHPGPVPVDWLPFLDATEELRSRVFDPDEPPADACRWQADMVRFLTLRRDALVERSELPAASTLQTLREIAGAIGEVERLRVSEDPDLAGPPPVDATLRDEWLRIRDEKLRPMQRHLDLLLETARRERSPGLLGETWPTRLVTCVTACQRHFSDRLAVGERRATNRDLALAQWDAVLEAARALEGLAQAADP